MAALTFASMSASSDSLSQRLREAGGASRLADQPRLAGESAQSIPPQTVPSVTMVDWRQLRRWGIDETQIPPGSGRLMNLAIAGAFRSALGRGLLVRLPAIKHYRKLYRALFAQEMADWPEGIHDLLIERHVSLEWLFIGLQESKNVDQLYEEIRHAGPIPDVPLIVLCSIGTDGCKEAVSVGESESLLREEIDGKRRLYTAMVESVPRGEIRLVDDGHVTMHLRHPEAVAEAILDLLWRATTAGG